MCLPIYLSLQICGHLEEEEEESPPLPPSVCLSAPLQTNFRGGPVRGPACIYGEIGRPIRREKRRKDWFFFFLFSSWRTWGSRRDEKESKEKERQREKERKLRLGIRRKKSCRLHLCLPERSYDPPTAGATDTRQERERETQKERKIICTKNGGAKTEKKEEKKPWPV